MNKAYLLVICLLLAPFTGCIEVTKEESEITTEPVGDEDNSQIDETKDESDNTEEKELVKGCMDSNAMNYDSIANTDDGTCYYLDCMDEAADNYNSAAVEEGYCVYLGCTDASSPNYDATANTDDGTCEYLGCIDEAAFNTTEGANTDDGSCYSVIEGCTDELAYNYVATS